MSGSWLLRAPLHSVCSTNHNHHNHHHNHDNDNDNGSKSNRITYIRLNLIFIVVERRRSNVEAFFFSCAENTANVIPDGHKISTARFILIVTLLAVAVGIVVYLARKSYLKVK